MMLPRSKFISDLEISHSFPLSQSENRWMSRKEHRGHEEHAGFGQGQGRCLDNEGAVKRNDEGRYQ